MILLREFLRGLAETIREVFPTSEADAGPWLAGFCVAFVTHWLLLIAVTWAHCSRTGTC